MAKQPHYPGSLVPDTRHKVVQSKSMESDNCKSVLIFLFMIESVCMGYVMYELINLGQYSES